MYGVIFDLDGTLLDTQRIYIPAWDYAGEKQGFKNCGDHIKYVLGTNEESWSQYLADKFVGMDVPAFKADATLYIKENIKIKFKKGAKEFVEYLRQKGIPFAIGSGGNTEVIRKYLEILGVSDWFEYIVGGDQVQNSKPAPDTFLLAAKKMGVAPENCFVFEDSDNGVCAAVRGGIKCIGIPDIAPFGKAARDSLFKELNSMDEAVEIFENLLN